MKLRITFACFFADTFFRNLPSPRSADVCCVVDIRFGENRHTQAHGIRNDFDVFEHPRKKRSAVYSALETFPSSVLQATNEIKQSTLIPSVDKHFLPCHNNVCGVVILSSITVHFLHF